MEQIAWIFGNTYLYWSSVIRTLAAGAAAGCFLSLYLRKNGKIGAAAVFMPLALILSLVLSRLAHWYFLPNRYESIHAALQWRQPGGFALAGTFAGCLLAAGFVRIAGLTRNLPDLLDNLCIAGCLGMAVGRQASWFGSADRGMILSAEGWYPWVSAVINPVSGAEEHRTAVFLIQGAVAAVLFLGLLIWFLLRKQGQRAGDVTLVFLLCYSASQVLLDSMRYDSLHFRSNGFVSVTQVLSAGGILLTAVIFAVRLVHRTGWKKLYLLLWVLQAGCVGLAGYMEYYVQRHRYEAAMAYGIMGAALLVLVVLTMLNRHWASTDRENG